jgi:DNA primase
MRGRDVRAELEAFEWTRATWTDDRLIAASPFRYDKTPSFYVYLTDTPTSKAGYWGDPGADDPACGRGGIVKLLAFLRNETEYDTFEYLRYKYGDYAAESEDITLNPLRLEVKETRRPLPMTLLDRYHFRHPYLERRGISEAVQRLMRVGYDRTRQAVVIPWFNANGTLGNVKYRSVRSKTFWYEKGGRPIREMVYGLDVIYSRKIRRAAIIEAEVDAMTLMSAGIPAIATGGAAFSDFKRELIAKSPLEEVVLFRDNDTAGRKWRNQAVAGLFPYIDVRIALVSAAFKDVNEWRDFAAIRRAYERSKAIRDGYEIC